MTSSGLLYCNSLLDGINTFNVCVSVSLYLRGQVVPQADYACKIQMCVVVSVSTVVWDQSPTSFICLVLVATVRWLRWLGAFPFVVFEVVCTSQIITPVCCSSHGSDSVRHATSTYFPHLECLTENKLRPIISRHISCKECFTDLHDIYSLQPTQQRAWVDENGRTNVSSFIADLDSVCVIVNNGRA